MSVAAAADRGERPGTQRPTVPCRERRLSWGEGGGKLILPYSHTVWCKIIIGLVIVNAFEIFFRVFILLFLQGPIERSFT